MRRARLAGKSTKDREIRGVNVPFFPSVRRSASCHYGISNLAGKTKKPQTVAGWWLAFKRSSASKKEHKGCWCQRGELENDEERRDTRSLKGSTRSHGTEGWRWRWRARARERSRARRGTERGRSKERGKKKKRESGRGAENRAEKEREGRARGVRIKGH